MGAASSVPVDYDKVAPAYDRRYATGTYAGTTATLFDFVGPTPVDVLEVGCGTGHWLNLLSQADHRVVGVDASAGMLSRARGKVAGAALVNGRAEELPVGERRFDRLVCINAYHHFPERRAFLAEAKRVLRPGGAVLIVGLDPEKGVDRWCVYEYFPGTQLADQRRYAPTREIRADLQATGFERCETRSAERIEMTVPASVALEHGILDKRFTSQLTLLTDAEYEAGIARIRTAAELADRQGQPLQLITDVQLFATVAHRPA